MNLSHYPQTPLADYENTLVHLLRPFPVVRFMNWQQINRHSADERLLICECEDLPSHEQDWEYRGGAWSEFCGVPIERMVRLANLVDAQPWVCVPIAASDALIAHIVEHTVEYANRKPIIEFANEIWNQAFWQHQLAAESGMRLGLAEDAVGAALAWQAQRTRVIREVAGDSAEVVIAAQFFNPTVANTLLNYAGAHVDALAVAPYIGRNQSSLHKGIPRDLADIHQEIRDEIDTDVAQLVQRYHEFCEQHEVKLYAYEGGLHQVARNWDHVKQTTLSKGDFAQSKQTFLNYNRSLFAADNISHLWQVWCKNGGSTFCPYSLATAYKNVWNGDTQNQFFGHCEIVGKQIRILPKYRAVRDVVMRDA